MASELVAYSQNNPEWRNVTYAGNLTFRQAGCLVCCIASKYSEVSPDCHCPPQVAERLREAGAFSGGFLNHPSRIPDALPGLDWQGAIHWRKVPADIGLLAELVSIHGPIIAEVLWNPDLALCYLGADGRTKWNQHFVVVVAVDNMCVHIMNPWDGKFKPLIDSRHMLPEWDAARGIYGLRLVVPASTEEK